MKNILLKYLVIGLIVLINSTPVYAQAGEWTKCIAQLNNTTYNIVHGDWSSDFCLALALVCTQDPGVIVQYFPNPVTIKPPYKRCTKHWTWNKYELKAVNPEDAFCRVNCRMEVAQCYQGCVNSSNFTQCSEKCESGWGWCEDCCIGQTRFGDDSSWCWESDRGRRVSED